MKIAVSLYQLSVLSLAFLVDMTSRGSAQTTNAAASTPPMTTQSETLFGNKTISAQPSAEVTTLGYELTSHAASTIASKVAHSLPCLRSTVTDPKELSINKAQPIKTVLITNQKRVAMLTAQYEAIRAKLKYVADQSTNLTAEFSILNFLYNYHFEIATADEENILIQIRKEVHDSGYDITGPNSPISNISDSTYNSKGGSKSLSANAMDVNALSKYAVPYIGQATMAVDSLSSLVESVGKFASLFRSTENVTGVTISIQNEALNALTASYLQQKGVICYIADFLPEGTDPTFDQASPHASIVLTYLNKLVANSVDIQTEIDRLDEKGGTIATSPTTDAQAIASVSRFSFLAAVQQFVQSLPPNPPVGKAGDQIKAAKANILSAFKAELQDYTTSVKSLLDTMYGGNTSSTLKPAASTPKQGDSSATNAAPTITINNTPTINPTISITTGTVSATPASDSSKSPGPSAPTATTTSPSSLDAILQEEALYGKLNDTPLLYLNVVAAAGSNMTANGLFTSSYYFNAGIDVDYMLFTTDGAILVSGVEGRQSPYVKAVDHSSGERLPTVVTTQHGVTVRRDIDDLDDSEPETRFTKRTVGQAAASDKDH